MTKILFVGIHNYDPDGPSRLRKLIQTTNPDLITLELEGKTQLRTLVNFHYNVIDNTTRYSYAKTSSSLEWETFSQGIKTLSVFDEKQLAALHPQSAIDFFLSAGYMAWVPAEIRSQGKIRNPLAPIDAPNSLLFVSYQHAHDSQENLKDTMLEEVVELLQGNPALYRHIIDNDYIEMAPPPENYAYRASSALYEQCATWREPEPMLDMEELNSGSAICCRNQHMAKNLDRAVETGKFKTILHVGTLMSVFSEEHDIARYMGQKVNHEKIPLNTIMWM